MLVEQVTKFFGLLPETWARIKMLPWKKKGGKKEREKMIAHAHRSAWQARKIMLESFFSAVYPPVRESTISSNRLRTVSCSYCSNHTRWRNILWLGTTMSWDANARKDHSLYRKYLLACGAQSVPVPLYHSVCFFLDGVNSAYSASEIARDRTRSFFAKIQGGNITKSIGLRN